jgi:hypothetical protein
LGRRRPDYRCRPSSSIFCSDRERLGFVFGRDYKRLQAPNFVEVP